MGRIGYAAQRVELLRSLADSITDVRSRSVVLDLAGKAERRQRDRAAALESINDRIAAQ